MRFVEKRLSQLRRLPIDTGEIFPADPSRSLPISDFDERMTCYQVEHIAGVRGSITKYIPPRCDTLRTHGTCPAIDEICENTPPTCLLWKKAKDHEIGFNLEVLESTIFRNGRPNFPWKRKKPL